MDFFYLLGRMSIRESRNGAKGGNEFGQTMLHACIEQPAATWKYNPKNVPIYLSPPRILSANPSVCGVVSSPTSSSSSFLYQRRHRPTYWERGGSVSLTYIILPKKVFCGRTLFCLRKKSDERKWVASINQPLPDLGEQACVQPGG